MNLTEGGDYHRQGIGSFQYGRGKHEGRTANWIPTATYGTTLLGGRGRATIRGQAGGYRCRGDATQGYTNTIVKQQKPKEKEVM